MTEVNEIRPTGHCFDDALDYIEWQCRENLAHGETLLLVHGICLAPSGPQAGAPFAHAWVQDGDQIWASGLVTLEGEEHRCYYAVDRAEYEREFRVISVTRYTVREALEENRRSNHYGPWKPEYQALCGPGTRVMGAVAATYEPKGGL